MKNKDSRKKILLHPDKLWTNKYLDNLYNTIKDEYEVIGYKGVKKSIKIFLCDVYHFNWIETEKKRFTKLDYIAKRIFINILKILNKKIIWTVHNSKPHEARDEKSAIKFMKFMAQKSDRIHVLCNVTRDAEILKKYQEKIVYIPHGDYIQSYKECQIDIYNRYNISADKKIILFIGNIRKYKNIELLINSFIESKIESDGYILLVCGNCGNEEYKKELIEMSSSNIYFDFSFIKDDEIEAYLRSADIVIAPYNKNSSINSGTLWMAMSYKKTMILPLIGGVKDINNYDDFLYVYNYKDEGQHYNELLKTMLKIKQDIEKDKNILKIKGEKAYNYIANNQTWKIWKEKWIQLYKF